MIGDLRRALRLLGRHPGFTAVVVMTLAVGIGASTAVYSVVDALLLRSLPVKQPDNLVLVATTGPRGTYINQTYPLFEQLRDGARSFDGVLACANPAQRRLVAVGAGATETESVMTAEVSGNFFPMLGVAAHAGRLLGVEDDQAGRPPAAVISHAFWQRRFGGDRAIVGKTVIVDDTAFTVVGVAARGFGGIEIGSDIELWCPIQLSPLIDFDRPWRNGLKSDGLLWITIMARLRPGVAREQARAEIDVLYRQKAAETPEARVNAMPAATQRDFRERRIEVQPGAAGYSVVREQFQKPLTVLMAAVALMLLAAGSNVAGLMIARGASRGREMALRSVLGASRGRIVRQLLSESLLLALAGGAMGLLFATWGRQILQGFLAQRGGALTLELDGRVLGFAFGVTVVTGLSCGIFPALRLSGFDLSTAIKNQANAIAGSQRQMLGQVLIVAEIALAFCLVVGAALFGQTLRNLAAIETGFSRTAKLMFELEPGSGYNAAQRIALYPRVVAALETIPGVQQATFAFGGLLGDINESRRFSVAGREVAPGEIPMSRVVLAGPHFFETMGIPLLRGRRFGPGDLQPPGGAGQLGQSGLVRRAAIISAVMGQKFFGDEDPLRQTLTAGTLAFEIVGVAKETKYSNLREEARGVIYLPYAQSSPRNFSVTFAMEAARGVLPSIASIRAALERIDPKIQIAGLRTFESVLARQTAQEQMVARLSGVFGCFALGLSGLGVFGMLAFNVARRTREIGVRMALGATAGNVLGMIFRQGVGLVALGCVVGAACALALGRLVGNLLYGVPAADALTFFATTALLLFVAAAACLLPARRATKVDPQIALRAE